jgi:hypothetical protein
MSVKIMLRFVVHTELHVSQVVMFVLQVFNQSAAVCRIELPNIQVRFSSNHPAED